MLTCGHNENSDEPKKQTPFVGAWQTTGRRFELNVGGRESSGGLRACTGHRNSCVDGGPDGHGSVGNGLEARALPVSNIAATFVCNGVGQVPC